MAQKYSLPVIFCSLFATPDMISNVPLIMLSEAGAQWKVHQQKREKKGGEKREGEGPGREGDRRGEEEMEQEGKRRGGDAKGINQRQRKK